MSPDIDVVVSGHTHQAYNCVMGNKLVTSASSFGRLITDIDLTIDKATGDVVQKTATNRIVTRTVEKDASETELVSKYKTLAAPLANKVIGSISSDITRTTNAAGESALGDVIADSQLAATKSAATGNSVVAFMNPGGIRAELTFDQQSGGEQPGQVTYGEAFTVQPFVEHPRREDHDRRHDQAAARAAVRQPGEGSAPGAAGLERLHYSFDASKLAGSRVDASSIKIGGVTVVPATKYRVTMNSFLADGGDGFSVFNEGTDQLGGDVDIDASGGVLRRPEDGVARSAKPDRPHGLGELSRRRAGSGNSFPPPVRGYTPHPLWPTTPWSTPTRASKRASGPPVPTGS